MKHHTVPLICLLCCVILLGCSTKTVVTSSSPIASSPIATPLPILITEPTNTQEIRRSFTPIPSPTPWEFPSGLSIEEHPLAKRPELEPLLLFPLDNLTQEQMFAKHAKELQNGLRPESYYGICGCTLWVLQGKDKLETFYTHGTPGPNQRVLVGVTRNGKIIFSTWNEAPGVTSEFRVLATYDDHWVLELAERKEVQKNQEVDSFFRGKIYVDGKSLNELYGYEESYGFQTIHGRPFYFYKKNGKIGISYDGAEIALRLDGVRHYGCCSAGGLNPRMAQNMIAFFAWRGDQWYYMEIGVFGTS